MVEVHRKTKIKNLVNLPQNGSLSLISIGLMAVIRYTTIVVAPEFPFKAPKIPQCRYSDGLFFWKFKMDALQINRRASHCPEALKLPDDCFVETIVTIAQSFQW